MKRFHFIIFATLLLFACSSNRDLAGPPYNNPKQLLTLEDRLLQKPGVFIQGGQVRIRGGDQSFLSGSEPLFEINGQVVSGGFASVKSLVGPMDIKSIRVLKNPDELAIYGARGLNGVVKIQLNNAVGSSY
ncbi:MAG: TonB-dependent receptor plug domain-containing protein [Bacteroidota bacterium]